MGDYGSTDSNVLPWLSGSGATDFGSGPPIASPGDNPSNGLGLGALFGQLIGTAGSAYNATQQANYAQAVAQSNAGNLALGSPLAIFSGPQGKSWLIIGAGLLALALILRR